MQRSGRNSVAAALAVSRVVVARSATHARAFTLPALLTGGDRRLTTTPSALAAVAPAAAPGEIRPEKRMEESLRQALEAQLVEVRDTSGGCGSFYSIVIVSPRFEGISAVKQHRVVNDVLENDIGKMHGLTLKTFTPAQWKARQTAL